MFLCVFLCVFLHLIFYDLLSRQITLTDNSILNVMVFVNVIVYDILIKMLNYLYIYIYKHIFIKTFIFKPFLATEMVSLHRLVVSSVRLLFFHISFSSIFHNKPMRTATIFYNPLIRK